MTSLPISRTFLPVLLLMSSPLMAGQWVFDGIERVVAISDIHGAHRALVSTMQRADVIDAAQAWSGGETHLVIVGDILDRGPDSRQSLDLLMRLEAEATEAGGRVHVLLGNHETLALTGDLRYVTREEYAAFAAEESQEERQRWFEQFVTKRERPGQSAEEMRQRFDESFPPGFFAYREAFGFDGVYGEWLLSRPVMIVINRTAFVHGGVSPLIGQLGLERVNAQIKAELEAYLAQTQMLTNAGILLPTDSYVEQGEIAVAGLSGMPPSEEIAAGLQTIQQLERSELMGLNGPLWYRGNVACNAIVEVDRIDAVLSAIGAERIVIGHTPTVGRQVLERFDGRVIEVDTGMLVDYYNGQGSALVIEADQVRVVHESGQGVAEPLPHPRRVGLRPDSLDVEQLENLLAEGSVIADTEDESGRRILTISDGKYRVDAEFDRRAGRNFYPEVAAYRLDRLLGLDMVPVAVPRSIDGREGSLQFRPPGTTNEINRRETGLGGSAWCPLPLQWAAMTIFDALILNDGRVQPSMFYTRSNWQLMLTGHSLAFGTRKGRPRHLEGIALDVSGGWTRSLEALDDAQLEGALADALDPRRLKALMARRDLLLAEQVDQNR